MSLTWETPARSVRVASTERGGGDMQRTYGAIWCCIHTVMALEEKAVLAGVCEPMRPLARLLSCDWRADIGGTFAVLVGGLGR